VLTRNFQDAVRFLLPSIASKLEQVANLLRAQANSASYLPWDGKWVLRATGLSPSVADWGGGMSASCKLQTAGPIVR